MGSDRHQRTQLAGEGFLLGAKRFEKISAVEGIKLSDAMRQRARESERQGLSAEQRREQIKSAYREG